MLVRSSEHTFRCAFASTSRHSCCFRLPSRPSHSPPSRAGECSLRPSAPNLSPLSSGGTSLPLRVPSPLGCYCGMASRYRARCSRRTCSRSIGSSGSSRLAEPHGASSGGSKLGEDIARRGCESATWTSGITAARRQSLATAVVLAVLLSSTLLMTVTAHSAFEAYLNLAASLASERTCLLLALATARQRRPPQLRRRVRPPIRESRTEGFPHPAKCPPRR